MEFIICIGSAISTTVLLGIIAFLAKNWLLERLKLSLQKEHTKFQEELKWEIKTREQAEKVAEYLAHVHQLKETSSDEAYVKANQLSWELAMWIPEEIYRKTVQAIMNPSETVNVLSTVIDVRKLLLKDKAGSLTQEDIAHHAPGIGKKKD